VTDDLASTLSWLWIPIALAAAAAQTVRNAVQRNVTKSAGVLPATFIRFFYGLPFAAAMLAGIAIASPEALPSPTLPFVAWVTLGAISQVAAMAFFLAAMAQRSFVVAVVFTKTEVLQVGIYSVLFLVRIVGLVEVIYSYAVSRRLFREPVTRLELWGMVLVVLGIVLVSAGR